MNATVSIQEAEGFCELGLWKEAWDALDSLPPSAQSTREALRVRLACSPGLDRWDVGTDVAMLLEASATEDRKAAAHFYQVFARESLRDGDQDCAESMALAAIEAWPGAQLDLLNNPELKELVSRLLEDQARELAEEFKENSRGSD